MLLFITGLVSDEKLNILFIKPLFLSTKKVLLFDDAIILLSLFTIIFPLNKFEGSRLNERFRFINQLTFKEDKLIEYNDPYVFKKSKSLLSIKDKLLLN